MKDKDTKLISEAYQNIDRAQYDPDYDDPDEYAAWEAETERDMKEVLLKNIDEFYNKGEAEGLKDIKDIVKALYNFVERKQRAGISKALDNMEEY